MPRSSSPFLFEEITGEIIFSHLTAAVYHCIMLPKSTHQSRLFSTKNDDIKVVFNCTKQLLMMDKHPLVRFEQLEADLFFKFSFNEILRLNIPNNLKDDLFIIGECESPIYTEKEKVIDQVLAKNLKLNSTNVVFPNQSPASLDDDLQLWSKERPTMINNRYCLFESTLKSENVTEKLLQLERLLAFFTARHLFRLRKCHQLLSNKMISPDVRRLIEFSQSNNYEKMTDEDISTLTSMTLSCIGFAGFSMPINVQSEIIQVLNNSNISQENQVQCRFHFLNAMLNTGRLLFYHVNDTEKGWRRAILTSMALLSERISAAELEQKSMHTDLNDLLDKTNLQIKAITGIRKSLDDIAKNNNSNCNIEQKMNLNTERTNQKINKLTDQFNMKIDKINVKIDGMQLSTSEELQKIIQLITFNEKKKKSRSCSCILL